MNAAQLVILISWNVFRDVQRLYLPRNVSVGLKNRKLVKRLLVLEWRNCDVKLRNVVIGADPSFLYINVYEAEIVKFLMIPLF